MKIFIFGSNGMAGNYMKKYLSKNYTIIALTRKDYDLEYLTVDSLTKLLMDKGLEKDDVVINCAGIIPQSNTGGNINNRKYFTINSIFPIVLSMICNNIKANLIHITTDCVYSGKDGNYDEYDNPDETNDYGLSKSLGDLSKCTIIRTSIIGEEINNKRSLLEWVISNKNGEINGYTNHHWNGITCLQLAKIVKDIINNNMYWDGIRHIFSPRSVNKYELLNMINDTYKLDIQINKFSTDKVDKTIKSIYDPLFDIPDLSIQINQTKSFLLKFN